MIYLSMYLSIYLSIKPIDLSRRAGDELVRARRLRGRPAQGRRHPCHCKHKFKTIEVRKMSMIA